MIGSKHKTCANCYLDWRVEGLPTEINMPEYICTWVVKCVCVCAEVFLQAMNLQISLWSASAQCSLLSHAQAWSSHSFHLHLFIFLSIHLFSCRLYAHPSFPPLDVHLSTKARGFKTFTDADTNSGGFHLNQPQLCTVTHFKGVRGRL